LDEEAVENFDVMLKIKIGGVEIVERVIDDFMDLLILIFIYIINNN
jgi:hypothetical protein